MSGHCFPFCGPRDQPISLSDITVLYPNVVLVLHLPSFLSQKELYSSVKNFCDAVDTLHPPLPPPSPRHAGNYADRGHGLTGSLLGFLLPPSLSPNFFAYFTFPIMATCITDRAKYIYISGLYRLKKCS